MSDLRVLLVDDSPEESSVIRRSLEAGGEGFLVTWTRDAGESCRLLADERFDLILLDLTLPDDWGLDGLARIATMAPDTPVLVLALPEDEELVRLAVAAGAAGSIQKNEMPSPEMEANIRSTVREHAVPAHSELRQRNPLSGFFEREAFFHLAQRHLRLASGTGKALLIFTARIENDSENQSVPDESSVVAAVAILRLMFRASDLVGQIEPRSFAALALVHPSDDSDVILARRFNEIVEAQNATVNRDRPVRLASRIERSSPEDLSLEDLRARLDHRWREIEN